MTSPHLPLDYSPGDDPPGVDPPGAGAPGGDDGLDAVVDWFRGQQDMQPRFAAALRQSIDEVLDGQRTGRFDITEAAKTEKTYLGTKVEIVIQATFGLARGTRMDYTVAGHEVDAKFSLHRQWSIPNEAMGHLCLLLAVDDHRSLFDAGLIRITPDALNQGKNQDGKRTLNQAARNTIVWLCARETLPTNLLLSLPAHTVEAIMAPRSGQQRINQLLRSTQGTPIDRNTAVTVARQDDGLKRCRDARTHLAAEGIVVLGHQNDSPKVASALGYPPLQKGTFLSLRLVPVPADTTDRPVARIDDAHYAVARGDDPAVPAPPIHY